MTVQTTFATGSSPWAGLTVHSTPKTAKERTLAPRKKPPSDVPKAPHSVSKTPTKPISLIGRVEITNDKPRKRAPKPSKYEAVFAALEPGQSIKCEPRHAHAIANALRAWQRRRGLNWKTAITLDYGDGFGRVFRIK